MLEQLQSSLKTERFVYLLLAGGRNDFRETNTNALSLVTLIAVQASLKDRNDLR